MNSYRSINDDCDLFYYFRFLKSLDTMPGNRDLTPEEIAQFEQGGGLAKKTVEVRTFLCRINLFIVYIDNYLLKSSEIF